MSLPPLVDPAAVGPALAAVVPELTRLIRGVREPSAAAIGRWDTGDVAVHLAHVWENLTTLADGGMAAPLDGIQGLGSLTDELVRGEQDRDLASIAQRIEDRAAAFLTTDVTMTAERTSAWLVQGIAVRRLTLACHLLSESLVHGHDIARAQRTRWPINPAHAGLALLGFAFPVLAELDPRALVDQQRAAGVSARYEIIVRGTGRVFLTVADGAMTVSADPLRAVDCHLSAHAPTLLLLLFGRLNQWPALLSGRLVAWGRRPWLAPRLRVMVRNP